MNAGKIALYYKIKKENWNPPKMETKNPLTRLSIKKTDKKLAIYL